MHVVRENIYFYLPWDLGWCFFIVISGVLQFMALKSDPQTAVVLTPEHDGAANKHQLLALTYQPFTVVNTSNALMLGLNWYVMHVRRRKLRS